MSAMKLNFGIHETALGLKSRRLELLARNIANADTPHFKARDLDFKAVLAGQEGPSRPMAATHERHLPAAPDAPAAGERFRIPFNTAFDGNTVELSVEQAHYGKASADYQATLSFIESRISGIRKALRGE